MLHKYQPSDTYILFISLILLQLHFSAVSLLYKAPAIPPITIVFSKKTVTYSYCWSKMSFYMHDIVTILQSSCELQRSYKGAGNPFKLLPICVYPKTN